MANNPNRSKRRSPGKGKARGKAKIVDEGKKARSALSTEEEFKRAAIRRIKDWTQGSAEGTAFQETPEDRLVRCCYRWMRSLLKQNAEAKLAVLLRNAGKRHKGPHDINGKPFKQFLLLMSWWCQESLGRPLMSPKRRMNLSDAMEYAHRHGVRSRHINGFIKQAGIGTIRAKLDAGYFEPGFEDPKAQ